MFTATKPPACHLRRRTGTSPSTEPAAHSPPDREGGASPSKHLTHYTAGTRRPRVTFLPTPTTRPNAGRCQRVGREFLHGQSPEKEDRTQDRSTPTQPHTHQTHHPDSVDVFRRDREPRRPHIHPTPEQRGATNTAQNSSTTITRVRYTHPYPTLPQYPNASTQRCQDPTSPAAGVREQDDGPNLHPPIGPLECAKVMGPHSHKAKTARTAPTMP
jgi:hypothetical protein